MLRVHHSSLGLRLVTAIKPLLGLDLSNVEPIKSATSCV
jgi:hypothetical protein